MKTKLLFAICFLTIGLKAQIIATIAGDSTQGYSGDSGPATIAELYRPAGIALDASGNLYIADVDNNVIRKVNTAGTISTIAGNGIAGYAGDGGPATAAELNEPSGVAVDNLGNVYFSEYVNQRIRKVSTAGIISTYAGTGMQGYNGNGGYATAAWLNNPYGITLDALGNLYIADQGNNRVRKVNTAGIISTIAGIGSMGYGGDGGYATGAEFYSPTGVTLDTYGNIYIADVGNNVIRMINTTGIINSIAGNGYAATGSYSGDGGPATAANLSLPTDVTLDPLGNLYIADQGNNRVRKVNTAGIITTFAGNGTGGYTGDGGYASIAEINSSYGITTDVSGNLYISDFVDNCVRKVTDCVTSPISLSVSGTNTICAGGSTAITVNISGANTYTWSANAGGIVGTTSDSLVLSPITTTSYSITSINGGCFAQNVIIITVNPTLSIVSNTDTICNGNMQTIAVSGASSYTWTPATALSNPNIANPVANPTTTTIYTVTGTSPCGIISPLTVTINVITTPTLSLASDSYTVCQGSWLNLSASGAASYIWGPISCIPASYYVANPWAVVYTTTVFTVTGSNACGISSPLTVTVNVNPSPIVSYTLQTDTVPHVWDAYPTYSSNVTSARWYWGDGDTTVGLYPSHTYSVAGLYNICVAVTDTAGCTATYCQNDSVYRTTSIIQINVVNNATGISQISGLNTQVSIYPNPNNGLFVIEPNSTTKQTMQVYDINGKLVLSQTINSKTSIDASGLNEGVYNISLLSNEGVVNKRLVIVR